jgi:hypothetical protein
MSAFVHILVEGQTEGAFVNQVLKGHLARHGVEVNIIIVKTRRGHSGPAHRGGSVSYSQLRKQLLELLADSRATAVTTLIDYYPLMSDLPTVDPTGSGVLHARALEAAMATDINHPHFTAHYQVHDYEALLFAAPALTAQSLGESPDALVKVRNAYPTPEDINDTPSTCPAARLQNACPGYDKAVDGPRIAAAIGLDTLRTACPHFGEWLTSLEALGAANSHG